MITTYKTHPKDTHSQDIFITYPRSVQISFGNYPYPDQIHNWIIEIKKNIDKETSYASNVKGNTTHWNIFVDHPLTTKFINYCINIHQKQNPNLFAYFYERNTIINCWGNEIKKGDWVDEHTHSTHHGILYLTEGNPLILPELNLKITPKPGDYYWFPPEIKHYVEKSEIDNNRYNIIFNVDEKSDIEKWSKKKRIDKKKEIIS